MRRTMLLLIGNLKRVLIKRFIYICDIAMEHVEQAFVFDNDNAVPISMTFCAVSDIYIIIIRNISKNQSEKFSQSTLRPHKSSPPP